MILHIEAGHRHDASGDLIDCFILTDENGQHVAATPTATIVDFGRAEAICAAVNARDQVRTAMSAAADAIEALPHLTDEALRESAAAHEAIAEALRMMPA